MTSVDIYLQAVPAGFNILLCEPGVPCATTTTPEPETPIGMNTLVGSEGGFLVFPDFGKIKRRRRKRRDEEVLGVM